MAPGPELRPGTFVFSFCLDCSLWVSLCKSLNATTNRQSFDCKGCGGRFHWRVLRCPSKALQRTSSTGQSCIFLSFSFFVFSVPLKLQGPLCCRPTMLAIQSAESESASSSLSRNSNILCRTHSSVKIWQRRFRQRWEMALRYFALRSRVRSVFPSWSQSFHWHDQTHSFYETIGLHCWRGSNLSVCNDLWHVL